MTTTKLWLVTRSFKEVDRAYNRCIFLDYVTIKRQVNTDISPSGGTYLISILVQTTYDYYDEYIPFVEVYYEEAALSYVFDTLLNNIDTRNYICDVAEGCPETNPGMSHQDCVSELEALPVFTEGSAHFDGNSRACRTLHAVFAEKNQDHCAHLSIAPQEDPKGNTKCQQSQGIHYLDLFDEQDVENFREWMDGPASLIESTSGFKILETQKGTNNVQSVILAAVVPCLIFIGGFCLVRQSASKENEDEENARLGALEGTMKERKAQNKLMKDKARRLRIVGSVIAGALVTVNVVIACVVFFFIPIWRPDWDQYEPPENPLKDRYRGDLSLAGDTIPHVHLEDDQFQVYVGFIVWLTTFLAGIGLESFVWYYFLQVWSTSVEGAWRFVQFVFPLMAVTALGFASHQNFWSLPMTVLGCWKWGFPGKNGQDLLGYCAQGANFCF